MTIDPAIMPIVGKVIAKVAPWLVFAWLWLLWRAALALDERDRRKRRR